jgi:hypothetical protein
MALTMTRTKQFALLATTALSFALAALVSGGVVSAQINPATAMSAAKNGAQAANTSATQSQSTSATAKPSQTSATNPQNKMNTSATQASGKQNTNPPAADKKTPAQKQAKADNKAAAASTKTVPAQKAPPTGDVSRTTKPTLPQGRRDPFITLVGKQTGGGGPAVNLPPGKGGLQVSTLILQGIVSGPNGMIAVVANPQKSVYFLRAGDELFDGRVDKIEIGSVSFHEVGKDAFGNPVEREVTRKLNPSSGDQP